MSYNQTQVRYDYATAYAFRYSFSTGFSLPPIVNLPNGPYAASSTIIYQAQIVDGSGNGIPADQLAYLLLTIADTMTGAIINDVDRVNILNTGRGTVDANGNLVVKLEPADSSMSEVPGAYQVERSLIFDWSTGDVLTADDGVTPLTADDGITPLTIGDSTTGRHQANLFLLRLAA